MSDSLKATFSSFHVSAFISEASFESFTNGLLDKFPQLKTERARSLGEAIDKAIPAIAAAGVVVIAALAVRAIGAAALALSAKVLISLAVIALALYLVSKIGPPALKERLDKIFEKINLNFEFDGQVTLSDVTSELRGRKYENIS